MCKSDCDRFGVPIKLLSLNIANGVLKWLTGLSFGAETISLIGYSFVALPAASGDNKVYLCVRVSV